MQPRYLIAAEDDPDDQDDLRAMFSDIDPHLHVVICNNGLELMQYITAIPSKDPMPQSIILDINMPIWDGIRTLQALQSDSKFTGIPVIIFSTSALQKDNDLCIRLGAKAFITKPIHHQEWVNVKRQLATLLELMTEDEKEAQQKSPR